MHRVAWELSVTFYVCDEQHLVSMCDINISSTVPARQQMIASSARKVNSSQAVFRRLRVCCDQLPSNLPVVDHTRTHAMLTKCQSPRCIFFFSDSVHSYFLTLIQRCYYFHCCLRHAISFNSHPATVMFMPTASCIGGIIVPHLTGCVKRGQGSVVSDNHILG